jgi:hypothetical protein
MGVRWGLGARSSHGQAKRLFGSMGISESPTLVTMGQDGVAGIRITVSRLFE